MDSSLGVDSQYETFKIEDIIDIQKARGTFSFRQVAFNLPTESPETSKLTKSLESGLSKAKTKFKPESIQKQLKKLRSKRSKSPEIISWPSDSDITVLRIKFLTNTDKKQQLVNVFLGDGTHQADSSSMVNLATMLAQSQTSKNSMNVEEYLLPLTSWEQKSENILVEEMSATVEPKLESQTYTTSLVRDKCLVSKDSDYSIRTSKVARFLRLYFCPCWTSLYHLETMRENH